YEIVPEADTEAALKRLDIDLSRPQFVQQLRAVGQELKARYVFYPRVLAVGIPPNRKDPSEYQATIILNVGDPERKALLHAYQVGQVFRARDRMLEQAVITRRAADDAAQRLLAGF